MKDKSVITYMRPKRQESEPLTASVHYNGHLSIMIQLWFCGQTVLSVAGSCAEQVLLMLQLQVSGSSCIISILALPSLTKSCQVLELSL